VSQKSPLSALARLLAVAAHLFAIAPLALWCLITIAFAADSVTSPERQFLDKKVTLAPGAEELRSSITVETFARRLGNGKWERTGDGTGWVYRVEGFDELNRRRMSTAVLLVDLPGDDVAWLSRWSVDGQDVDARTRGVLAFRFLRPDDTGDGSLARFGPPFRAFAGGRQLSSSEENDLLRTIAPCWNADPKGPRVEITVTLGPNATVREVEIVDAERYARDAAFRTSADAARRAVLHPSCSKLPLDPNVYRASQPLTLELDAHAAFR
jgi:hypothetical protein